MVLKVALLVGLFGFIMSRKQLLEWIAPMSSLNALILWYVAFGVFLSLLGFFVFQGHWNPRYTLALLVISWALGIVLYYPVSPYSTGITGAEITAVESSTEDYVTNEFLSGMGVNDSSGIITYAIIPFLLLLFAGLVVAPNWFGRILQTGVGRA